MRGVIFPGQERAELREFPDPQASGDDVVEHYLNQARIEVEAYDAAVTDWECVRGFERL